MHVWHVQMMAEQQPPSAHPALLQAVTELGTHCPVPSPILAEISGSAARSLRRSGASGLLRQERQKTKIMPSGPITSWEIDGETVETVADFILGVALCNQR